MAILVRPLIEQIIVVLLASTYELSVLRNLFRIDMAIEKEEVDKLKSELKKIYSKAGGQFLYCPAGKNGDPILVLSAKKITMDQVKIVREKAKVKTFIRGRIVLEAGKAGKELVFYTKQDPPGKLVKHVNQFFGRSVSN